jgi:hypothetical protein
MSCDHTAYCSTIVDLASHSRVAGKLGDYPSAMETDVACDNSLNRCRSGPTADQFRLKAHRHEVRSRIIPDSTQTDPEYVWGDEGPINELKRS